MGLVHVWEDERDKPNIQITHQDRRSPHVLHGYRNDDPKTKVVRVGIDIPRPQNYIEIRQGNKVYEQEAHSPVRNFYARLLCQIGGVSQLISAGFTIRKQDNTLDTGDYIPNDDYASSNVELAGNHGFYAYTASDTFGIVLGTGNTAWDLDNYIPEALIQQGVTAGKLVYSATPSPIISYTDGVWTVIGRRVFDNFNADANTITVKEVCQFIPLYGTGSTELFVYLDERTVLVTPKDIPYKSGAVFTYTRALTVPALGVLSSNGLALLVAQAFCVNNYDSADVFGSGYRTMKTIDGTIFSGLYQIKRPTSATGSIIYNGAAGLLTKGCVAGYGTTAVADTDYVLDDEFAHGSLENQLGYSAQDTPSAVYDAPSKTFTVTQSRTLTNNYAGNQSITEIGIVGGYAQSATVSGFLMSRTVLGSAVVLAQNESISIIYDFTMTHP